MFGKIALKCDELLKSTPVRQLMEPLPLPLLKPSMTITEAGHAFVEHGHEFFYVSADGQSLDGVVTITDLNRGQPGSLGRDTPATEFMTRNPVVVAADDDCTVAAMAIREYRLKSLPVVERKDSRKLVGCIRIRRVMAYVMKEARAPAAVASTPVEPAKTA